tara:strand:- start:2 stop:1906 length:1905 start_codon:yes stop_codon:yes gene_type:complete
MRDAQTAGIHMTEQMTAKEISKVYKNLGSAIRGIYRASREKEETTGFNWIYKKDLSPGAKKILAWMKKNKLEKHSEIKLKDIPDEIAEELLELGIIGKQGKISDEIVVDKDGSATGIKGEKYKPFILTHYMLADTDIVYKRKTRDTRLGRTGGWTYYYNLFKMSGAKVGWMDQLTIEEKFEDIQSIIDRLNGKKKVRNALAVTGQFIEDLNMAVENGIRLAVFRQMLEKGVSEEKSAQFAKNLTVNFNKKGTSTAFINNLWVFSNAGIQGSFRLLSGAVKHPKTRKILAGISAYAFLMSFMQRALDPGDDEEPGAWERVGAYEKDNHLLIGIPGTDLMGSIKIGYGINSFWALGTILEDYLAGQEWYQEFLGLPKGSGIQGGEVISRLVVSVMNGFNPFPGSTVGQSMAPTLLTPLVQWGENKNFFGGPIYKEPYPGNAPGPDHTMYWKSAYPISKDATEALFNLTNGEMDINPESLDHFMTAYGGGITKDVLDVINGVYEGIKEGEFPVPDNFPLKRIFVKEATGYNHTSNFYDMFDESSKSLFTLEEVHRFYRQGWIAVKLEKVTPDQFKKKTKQFVKNQKKFIKEYGFDAPTPPSPSQLGYKLSHIDKDKGLNENLIKIDDTTVKKYRGYN